MDLAEAQGFANSCGVHGAYVVNSLSEDPAGDLDTSLALHCAEGIGGLLFFGHRGNLIVLGAADLDPERVAQSIHETGESWRIVLGPVPVAAALRARESRQPLVDRCQVYYEVRDAAGVGDPGGVECRRASRADEKALMQAALELNRLDLNVDAWRVNKSWLRDSVRRRIRAGRTLVIGEQGKLLCKLDVGSAGPGGVVIEGVYTAEAARGQGLARGLVAAAAREFLREYERVCLHVDAGNPAARRAYEAAGMVEVDRCQLLLRA